MTVSKILVFACALLLAVPAAAAERTIDVDGYGEAMAKPDAAEISVAVIANATTASDAMALVSSKAAVLLKTVASHNIPEKNIQTGNVSLNPVYQRIKNSTSQEAKIIGYTASIDHRILVTQLDNLGLLLDGVLRAGADRLNGLRFLVTDPATMQAEARRKAIDNAFVVAKQLTAAAGVQLGDVMSITQSSGGRSVSQQRMMSAIESHQGVPVMPGQVAERARVHIIFAIR